MLCDGPARQGWSGLLTGIRLKRPPDPPPPGGIRTLGGYEPSWASHVARELADITGCPSPLKLATMEGLAPVQDLLDPTFPYMNPQQVQQVELLVGRGGASAAGSPSTQVWRFEDGAG